jgi:hypothetical protein
MAGFGHKTVKTFPALTALTVKHPALPSLKGIRLKPCAVTLYDGQTLAQDTGEILFTEYGLSGIPVFQISGYMAGRNAATVELNILPEISDALSFFRERQKILSERPAEDFFTGLFHKQIGMALLRESGAFSPSITFSKESGAFSPDMRCADIPDTTLACLAKRATAWPFTVTGTKGWQGAQVTGGGLCLTGFHAADLSSRFVPGLYAAGEVLDVYGDCGGYNLHWAWATGFLAGQGAARACVGK